MIDHHQKQQCVPSVTGMPMQPPCFKPYESDDDRVAGGVRLDFNYWISNGAPLVDQHIQEIIMSILNDDLNNSYISFRKYFKIKHLVVVTLHGIDPMMLQLQLSSLAFMSKLSCMPIRHTTSPSTVLNTIHCDECIRGTTTQWSATDIVPMNTLLLWTELPPIRIGNRVLLDKDGDSSYSQPVSAIDHRECAAMLHRLFRDGILLFKVRERERRRMLNCV